MKLLFAVFIGGGLGSVSRYGLSRLVVKLSDAHFPWATLAANLLSCALLGAVWWLAGKDFSRYPFWTALLVIGFCGGFSTFSTFSLETLKLLREGMFWLAATNVLVSVGVCVLMLHIIIKSQ